MQAEMAKAQEELKNETVEASAGGGMVKVTMTGDMQLREITISPDAIDPEDAELLQDMVTAAVNEALRAAQELAANRMGGITGGLGRRRTPRPARDVEPPRPLRWRHMYAGPISRLIAELSKLPGIGQRTAQRLAFHILRADDEDALALADAIREVKEKVGLCEVCFNLAEGERCRICEDARRDQSLICVVEEPADVIPIERTGEYRGVYHVLGGALSPIDGIDPEDLKITELIERVNGEVKEVVLATNPTTTGEATALHIADALREPRHGHPARQRPPGRRGPRARRRGDPRQGPVRPPVTRLVNPAERVRPYSSGYPPASELGGFPDGEARPDRPDDPCDFCHDDQHRKRHGKRAGRPRRGAEEVQEAALPQEEVREEEKEEGGCAPLAGHPGNTDLGDRHERRGRGPPCL